MEKFKSYAGQFLLVFAASAVALWAYDKYVNKPKTVTPPASEPAKQ